MKATSLLLFTVIIFATVAMARDESLAGLKTRCDSAPTQDQTKLCAEVAKFQMKAADAFYKAGNSEAAKSAIEDVASYGTKAADASIKSKKRLKDTEIDLRKMVQALGNLKRNADFEDQPPIQSAIDRLEKLRNDLLARMFGKGSK